LRIKKSRETSGYAGRAGARSFGDDHLHRWIKNRLVTGARQRKSRDRAYQGGGGFKIGKKKKIVISINSGRRTLVPKAERVRRGRPQSKKKEKMKRKGPGRERSF